MSYGLEGKLAAATFETSVRTPAVETVRAYLNGEFRLGASLVLSGATGVGKSWAAACAINGLVGYSRYFWYVPSLASALLALDRRERVMSDVGSVECAVMDDLGVEYLKPGGLLEVMLDEIVWRRENLALATIFTTNLSPEELRDRLSDRIISRLRGWGKTMRVNGPDLRESPTS